MHIKHDRNIQFRLAHLFHVYGMGISMPMSLPLCNFVANIWSYQQNLKDQLLQFIGKIIIWSMAIHF